MKNMKSHFWYTKSQRNGILLLIIVIVLFQIVHVFTSNIKSKSTLLTNNKVAALEKEIDSLKLEKEKKRSSYKLTPFNPNYISDFKGYKLGMSIEQIDRLHEFRKQQKFVNSIQEFQEVTKVSDSLLTKISPYFKFPSWVKNKERFNKKSTVASTKKHKYSSYDINEVTYRDLISVEAVNSKMANTIIKYRSKLQGFSYPNQLKEVWGMTTEAYKGILKTFKIIQKPKILKVNVNTASFKEVLKLPYVNYELCKKIFDYRDEVAELQKISELRNIKDFPQNKYDRIVLYLEAK